MQCIFCSNFSSGSRSREHIIPESLGNKDHILPPGVVCDSCNNYFARKIEEPLLNSTHFANLRSRQEIPNKKQKIPLTRALYPRARITVGIENSPAGMAVGPLNERDNQKFIEAISLHQTGTLWIPLEGYIDERLIARFLAKIAVEILAERFLRTGVDVNTINTTPELESIRRFARRGDFPIHWPIHRRRIYGEDTIFSHGYQVLHEFDIIYTDENEIYAVICIFGEEFAINLGGPSIEGYIKFINTQNGRSPLYADVDLDNIIKSNK